MSHIYFYNILKNLIPERIWDEKSLWLRVQRLWCWERLRAGREGGNRGWDDWMASLTQCTWVWANSGSWWRTGKPAMLQSMRWQRVGHDWVTEQQQWLEWSYRDSILKREPPWTMADGRDDGTVLMLSQSCSIKQPWTQCPVRSHSCFT